MLLELALLGGLSLAPAQAGELRLENLRSTLGEFGPAREKDTLRPGDTLLLSFDIAGVTVDASGRVAYGMGMELKDGTGKSIFAQKPTDNADYLPLGGTTLPARAFVDVPLEQAAGNYSLTLTVTDKATGKSASFTREYDVKPKEFGIVGLRTTFDAVGEMHAPLVGLTGQRVWVLFGIVEFQRDKSTKQPNLEVTMEIFDNESKLVARPTLLTVNKDVKDEDPGIPIRFMLPFNRAGDFRMRLKVTDKLSSKVDTVVLPIKVTPAAR